MLHLVYSCFDLVLMALFCAAIRRDSVSLLWFPFLSHVKFSHVRFHLFVTWNVHSAVFLPIFVFWLFLFCWCLCCLLFQVTVISLSLCFFYVFFLSLYWCNDIIWQDLFLLLFLTHTVCLYHLWDVRPYALSWVFLFFGPFIGVLL